MTIERNELLALVDKIRGGTRDGWGYGREECADFIARLAKPADEVDPEELEELISDRSAGRAADADADLSCAKCGMEQPADNLAPPKPAPIAGPIDFDPEMLRRDALIREEAPTPAPDAAREALALTAALSDQAGGWQDISTAPIKPYSDDLPSCYRFYCLLVNTRGEVVEGHAEYTYRKKDLVWKQARGERSFSPTHWQSLPAPPPSSAAGEG